MTDKFFNSLFSANLGRTAAQRGLLTGQFSYLLVKVSENITIAGITTLRSAGFYSEVFLCSRLHNHKLTCSQESGQVAVDAADIHSKLRNPRIHTFK